MRLLLGFQVLEPLIPKAKTPNPTMCSSAVAAMEGAFNLKHMGSMPVQCTNSKKV